jgi:hypothetical protein
MKQKGGGYKLPIDRLIINYLKMKKVSENNNRKEVKQTYQEMGNAKGYTKLSLKGERFEAESSISVNGIPIFEYKLLV